jgi:Peptidase family C25
LQNYLQFASTQWREKPRSVLLLGDASFDPRDYLGLAAFDFVPTRIIETAALKTASDDWLSDFQGTASPPFPPDVFPRAPLPTRLW